MENSVLTDDKFLNNENIYKTIFNIERKSVKADTSEVSYGLTIEEGKNFFYYLKRFNLAKDPDLLILPPNNHYYFDEKELEHVRTVVNLRNLNLVKDIDSFLDTLIRILPTNTNFLGYFTYNKITFSSDALISILTTRLTNMLDLKTDHNLDEKELTRRLYKSGFRVINMTVIDGNTYFYTRNVRQTKLIA